MNTFIRKLVVLAPGLLIPGIASPQQSTQQSPFAPAVGPPLVDLNSNSLENSEYMRSYARRVARARIDSENTLVIENQISTTIPTDSRARNVVIFTEINRSTVIVSPPNHDRRPMGDVAPPSPPPGE